jgi:hypothetical protein
MCLSSGAFPGIAHNRQQSTVILSRNVYQGLISRDIAGTFLPLQPPIVDATSVFVCSAVYEMLIQISLPYYSVYLSLDGPHLLFQLVDLAGIIRLPFGARQPLLQVAEFGTQGLQSALIAAVHLFLCHNLVSLC